MDFAHICRTCLYADTTTTLFSVFDPVVSEVDSGLGGMGTSAAEMLQSFTSVVITSDDQFSTKICSTCLDQIHTTYTFKIKCESSQGALKNLLEEFAPKQTAENTSPNDPSISEKSTSDTILQEISNLEEIISTNDAEINDFTDLLKLPRENLDALQNTSLTSEEEPISSLEDLSDADAQIISINLSFENLNQITKDLETIDNIIIEYGDPLAEPKENRAVWIEEVVECPGCHKEFRKIGLLRNHLVDVHTDGRICKICNEEYHTSIWKHIFTHMPGKDFPCKDCDKSFHSFFNLQMHRKIVHQAFITCEYCSMQFRNMQKFRDHMFQHTGRHEFQCDICLKVLKRKSALELHKKNHAGERPFKCKECSKTFGYKGNLNFHMIAAHGTEKLPHKCEVCSKRFKNRPQLVKHKFEHNKNPELQCDVCNEVFETKYKVELHKRRHTGEKPLKCEICGKGFRLKCNLKDHMGTHSDDRPFQCKLCPSRYKRSYLLTLHVRKEHPEFAKKMKGKSLRR